MTQQVLLLDACQVFRLGMREVIKATCPQAGFVEFTTLSEGVAALKRDSNITMVVMDLNLSDCDGLAGLCQIRSEFPDLPVILVSDKSDGTMADRASAFGAAGFAHKSSPIPEIVKMLAEIVRGKRWSAPPLPMNDDGGDVGSIASLSPAQFRILVGLQKGLRNKQIAFEMGVTEKTVKAYTTTMYRKLGVSSRTQALLVARKAFAGQNSV